MSAIGFGRFISGVLIGLAAGGRGAWLLAQQPAEPPPTFRAGLDMVRIEASVLDTQRRPVRGLTAADFVVLEDGRERPVVAFAPVELAAAPAAGVQAAGWVRDAPRDVASNASADAGRLVVIAFDWSIRFYDQPLARKIALAAVDNLGASDEAAVLFTRPNGAVGTPQGFTGDHARLRARINAPFGVALTDADPNKPWIIDPDGYSSGDCLCGMCTLEALTQLGKTLRTVSQRPKVVLFIGTYVRTFEAMRPTGVPPVIPGRITPSFAEMPGTTGCSLRLRDARRAFEQAMGESNTTVHVLDPVGLVTPMITPLGPTRERERLDSLPVMADLTGGRTVTSTSAPERQVASILDESRAYYVIGFTPDDAARANKTRRIEVRVKARDMTVKARREYNLAEEPASIGRGQTLLARAVTDVLPVGDVPLEVSAVPMIADRRSAALVVGRLDTGSARPTALLTAAFTPRAAPVASRRVTIPPAGGQASGGVTPLGLVSALALAPGAYEIRVATESGGAAGSVHTFVDIPDFGRDPLSMSGVLLHVLPEEPAAPRAEIDGVLPFAPTTRRSFRETDTAAAFVQVSQGTARKDDLRPVSMRLRITDAHDVTVRTQGSELGPAQFARNRTANARMTLPLAQLPAGQYLLSLEATSGDRRVERVMRFEMH